MSLACVLEMSGGLGELAHGNYWWDLPSRGFAACTDSGLGSAFDVGRRCGFYELDTDPGRVANRPVAIAHGAYGWSLGLRLGSLGRRPQTTGQRKSI